MFFINHISKCSGRPPPPPILYFLTSPLSLLLSLVPSDAVPSLLLYSLQIASRTPALFLVSLGTNIFSTPTQAQFPGNLRPILVFSYLSCLLPGALQLCFLARTRLLCKGTPAQRCRDASRIVLQGGVPGEYHFAGLSPVGTYLQLTAPAPSVVSRLLMIV